MLTIIIRDDHMPIAQLTVEYNPKSFLDETPDRQDKQTTLSARLAAMSINDHLHEIPGLKVVSYTEI